MVAERDGNEGGKGKLGFFLSSFSGFFFFFFPASFEVKEMASHGRR